MVERFGGMWSTGEGNGKPLQYSCLENPMNSMKRKNDRILKEKLPRSISWWWTGRPGVLWFMGSQRVGYDWATDLIWSDLCMIFPSVQSFSHVRLFLTPWTATQQASLVHHQLPEFTQTLVHPVGDAIQPSHPLSSPFPLTFNLSQHQGLFQWVSSLHQVPKVLEFQLQHQSFQWTFRTDFL